MIRPRIHDVLRSGSPGDEIEVHGWLRTARHAKGLTFLDVSDGSCMNGLQVVAPPELPNFEEEVRGLATGFAVRVSRRVGGFTWQGPTRRTPRVRDRGRR